MSIFGILTMTGGLALFLYGMKTMGDALSKMAGGRLESVIARMTATPIMAVLLGAGVTAVIQSSSATTVMVVGFVNSGIMKLSQAVGVIMGANIGTTVTSWLLSLTGIEGSSFFITLLKPSSFSPILAMAGVVIVMSKRLERHRELGTILIGFAILMFGMETMSDAVKPLAEVPEFTGLFTAFENPVLGMLVGALVTAVIQSSSASVGILQAVCATGSVSMASAIPIIMGQNIGTCVTALISSVGASRNARRASLVHLYFNLIGTAIFIMAFYCINYFLHFAFLGETATAAGIALIHSLFNVTATIILLPASKLLEKLAYLTIPVVEESENEEITEPKLLDERFLRQPGFAVAQVNNAVCEMARQSARAMQLCVTAFHRYDENIIKQISDIEADVDIREDELSVYINKISDKSLSARDKKLIAKCARWIVDLERISDYAKSITYSLTDAHNNGYFSENGARELGVMFEAASEIVDNALAAILHQDLEAALLADPLKDIIKSLKTRIREKHNVRLRNGECSVNLGMAMSDMVTSLERIAGHCSNIAEEEITSGSFEHALHRYAHSMKTGNGKYKNMLELYENKYSLEQQE